MSKIKAKPAALKTAPKPKSKAAPITKKKNAPTGAGHHSAKLTAAKVRQARKSFATGKWTIAALARKYDVSGPSMAAALRSQTWKHIQ